MKNSLIQIAFQRTQELIIDFESGIKHYLSASYQEAEVRKEYIDKFYTYLGWDVNHDFQKNPFEQEVKIEKAQRQQGALGQKRADYAFFLAPNYKQEQFFVEAKKPSRTLRQNKDDYFQTAKYGWNAGTGVSILTDFEEIVIIDCRFRPDFDTILQNEIKYYKYTDFKDFDSFEEFYWIFSREALIAGNLGIFIEKLKKPKGTAILLKSIDESFLNYIDGKRFELATAFYQNNNNLDAYELTEATQRTVDRIVFIRFLEDKLIETENIIHNIATAKHPWAKFVEYSKYLDSKYNGVVFKPLFIDDKKFGGANDDLFRVLCSDLDHNNTPYDFNYIPIHILGSIYERFLGKVVVIENGKATIEVKPEVRKAGGVFYTPKYIVDYIVKNTVGKLIEGKKPNQIAELTFADIACGSGSFLIGVFEYLLDYHNKWYNENPTVAKKDGCKYNEDFGVYVLSIQQKQHILLNNIYGVDIDLQATEVTQLSLFLKMLEDETTSTANDMMVLFHEKILPNLTNNIKCGNSLIGKDILTNKLDLDLDQERKLNPFDFKLAFPKVFKRNGFDAILGNPPYVFTRDVDIPDFVKDYYWNLYNLSKKDNSRKNQSGKVNLYVLFILRGSKLINENGYLSYIIPNGILRTTTYDTCRKYFIENTAIDEIVDLKDGVFKGVTTSTVILSLRNVIYKKNKTRIIDANCKIDQLIDSNKHTTINQMDFLKNTSFTISLYVNNDELAIFNKIKENSIELGIICKDIIAGIDAPKVLIHKDSYAFNSFKLLEGKDIKKYQTNFGGHFITWNKDEINRTRPEYLWKLKEKIVIQRISGGKTPLVANIDFDEFRCFASINILTINNTFNIYSYKLICAILNSNLMNYFYYKNFTNGSTLTVNISKTFLEQLPIPKLTKNNKETHDSIVILVEQMLLAKKQQKTVITERDKNYLEDKCKNIDIQINDLVYELYGLNDDEIAIIEKS